MLTNAALIWFARVAAVAGLTAAGAGGIYLVAPTVDRDGETGERQVAEQSPPPGETQTTPAPTPPDGATPAASVTAIPGLTDTGYVALDGRPLYAECMQSGATLPPVVPTPSSDQIVDPTPDPSRAPNEGKLAPATADLPSFDPLSITPADVAAWPRRTSACYGYAIALPPHWTVTTPFTQTGYQQGESATYRSPNGSVRVSISVIHTPVDSYTIENTRVSLSQSEYLISGPTQVEVGGAPGVRTYVYDSALPLAGVRTIYRYSPREHWYVAISVHLTRPYDEAAASEARAIVDSLSFQ